MEEFENPRIGFKWIPILLLYTGARPDEIASLPLANVRREKAGREDIDYFAITAGKTSSSLRKVPLHKAIRQSGFMDYLARRRKEEPGGIAREIQPFNPMQVDASSASAKIWKASSSGGMSASAAVAQSSGSHSSNSDC